MFSTFGRRSNLNIPRQHWIGGSKHCAKENRARERHPREGVTRKGDCGDRERHRENEQADSRLPAAITRKIVEPKAGAEQGDNDGKFTRQLPESGSFARIERFGHAGNERERGHPEQDERPRCSRLPSGEEPRQPKCQYDA
jgi:hypothetical protein